MQAINIYNISSYILLSYIKIILKIINISISFYIILYKKDLNENIERLSLDFGPENLITNEESDCNL